MAQASELDDQQARKRIEQLRKVLDQANYDYYVLGQNSLFDEQYDSLLDELRKLEEAFPEFFCATSPTKRLGADTHPDHFKFERVKHHAPMMSIDNTYSEAELESWLNGLEVEDTSYIVQWKVDGVALKLVYVNGLLEKAITRGDGEQGDDVTLNAKAIRSVPLKLSGKAPALLEVVGEVFITKSDFEQLEVDASNPRNLAAGTLKSISSAATKINERKLQFKAHGISWVQDQEIRPNLDDQASAFKWLTKLEEEYGMPIVPTWLTHSVAGVLSNIKHKLEDKDSVDMPVDGVVVKLSNMSKQAELGHGSKHVNYAKAYKTTAASTAITKLVKIDWQVGKQGYVTPRASLEPVELDGTTVSSASVHNPEFVESFGLYDGCEVEIYKAGEIIPQILKVTKPNPSADRGSCCIPESIDGVAVTKEGPKLKLVEEHPDQLLEKLKHFVGRDYMNILGFGPKLLQKLITAGKVTSPVGIVDLTPEDLADLDRVGTSYSIKLRGNIDTACDNATFARLLSALGFPRVGKKVSKELGKHYSTLRDLQDNYNEELVSNIDGFGPAILTAIAVMLEDPEFDYAVTMYAKYGLPLPAQEPEEESPMKASELTNKNVCVTGKFEMGSRKVVEARVIALGGIPDNSVKKTTDVLIHAGTETPSSSKYDKALKYGLKVLNEEEFLSL